jgi:mono/diheme cytochrome c family protein
MRRNRGDSIVSTNLEKTQLRLLYLTLAKVTGSIWHPLMIALMATGALALIAGANSARGQENDHATKSSGSPTGNVETGKQLFRKDGCYECHGSQGQIASRAGPALTPTLAPFDGFASYIRRPSGSMPAYTEKVLSNRELADIYAFLRSVPHPSK